MVSTREIVAYVELVAYAAAFIPTTFIVIRHGFHRQLGWVYLNLFCVVRIAGSVFEILSEKNPESSTDAEWAGILQSVGLSPLILASLGLLKRVIDETSSRVPSGASSRGNIIIEMASAKFGIIKRVAGKATAVARRSRFIQILQIPCMVALILCIVGGINEASSDASDQASGLTLFKVGILIFSAIYAILVILSAYSFSEMKQTPVAERRILRITVLALPLLAVRLLWSILSVFTNTSAFNPRGGSIWTQISMAIIEEILIVAMYVTLGFMVEKHAYSRGTTRDEYA